MTEVNERYYCVVITPADLSESAKAALRSRKAALLNEAKWPKGSVIGIKFVEGDKQLRNKVRSVAEEWIQPNMANLTFEWVESGPADVRIAFNQGNGSWSYLGTMCQTIPQSDPTMNYGWLTPASSDDEIKRVVLHEFGHAVGLIHEHQNPQHAIKWNEPAVIADLSGPPNNWPEPVIRSNVLDHYDPEKVTATPVDSKSIMMYPIPKSWTLDGFSAGFNGELSPTDKEFIHKIYP
jgi:serralysin